MYSSKMDEKENPCGKELAKYFCTLKFSRKNIDPVGNTIL